MKTNKYVDKHNQFNLLDNSFGMFRDKGEDQAVVGISKTNDPAHYETTYMDIEELTALRDYINGLISDMEKESKNKEES